MTNKEFEVMRNAQRQEKRMSILRELDSLKSELNTAKSGNYELHKPTDEYGQVITVADVMSIIDRHIEEYEE